MTDGVGPFGIPKLDPETRTRWIAEPGPSWREWVLGPFAKVYLGLAFFILDAILAATWLSPPVQPVGLVVTLPPAVYGEYLLAQYLWYVPSTPARHPRRSGPGRRSEGAGAGWNRLIHPVRFGRWTDDGIRWRRGEPVVPPDGPDPSEFL